MTMTTTTTATKYRAISATTTMTTTMTTTTMVREDGKKVKTMKGERKKIKTSRWSLNPSAWNQRRGES